MKHIGTLSLSHKGLLHFVVLFLLLSLAVSCGDSSTGPEDESSTGELEVTTKTSGIKNNESLNYSVEFKISTSKTTKIGANETVRIKNLEIGNHAVSLSGIRSDCVIKGDNPRKFYISAEDTKSTTFNVKCGIDDADKICGVTPRKIGEFTSYIGSYPSSEIKNGLSNAIEQNGVLFGITSKAHLQHFLAQTAAESIGFTVFTENLNYSAERLLQVFGKYFSRTDKSKADPDKYAGKPQKIANLVYANRIGNGSVASGDGYRYRGRGVIQLTGKANYRTFTKFYKSNISKDKNFVTNPELVASNKKIAFISGLWFFKKYVLDEITVDENTSVKDITLKINGGLNGLDRRKKNYGAVKQTISNCY